MSTKAQKTERLHALDSLRAIMMILGIVLHSVITYIGGEPYRAWRIRDPHNFNTNLEWVNSYIHVFRMPLFMLIAGFFAALLFYERGQKKMFQNRMSRITYPFLIFLPILFVPVAGGMSYTERVFASNPQALANTLKEYSSINSFIPDRTVHLWFLYYLIMFSVVSFLLGVLFKKLPQASQIVHRIFHSLFSQPIMRLIIFTAFTVLILLSMDSHWVATSTSLVPDFYTFIFYFYFYMIGWLLFKSKSLLDSFKKYDWLFTIFGTALFTWYFFADISNMDLWIKMTIRSLCCWLLIFGFTGLFIRYSSNHSPTMRYVSDASYWVYLIHLPMTVIIPALIASWNISGVAKFLFVTLVTTIICFATYHLFVRSTFIGKFLNGRKYSRKISDITDNNTAPIKVAPQLNR